MRLKTSAARPAISPRSMQPNKSHRALPAPGSAPPSWAPLARTAARRCLASGEMPTIETIAAELPVALVYNEVSHVVMMATPQDLGDFALGFSLSEGILRRPGEVADV